MKNAIRVLVLGYLIFGFITVEAQKAADSSKLFQKITGGMVLGAIASNTFSGAEKPFDLWYNLSLNVTIFTPKTYHNMLYGFRNNTLTSINGYFLPKDWDAYIIYSRKLHINEQYAGVGIEKMIKINDKVKFFLLSEIGTDFRGTNSLSFGLLMFFQNNIWKR